jgi:hypothetical protein
MIRCVIVVAFVIQASAAALRAAPTENLDLPILPAPGKVAIDGQVKDWDLTGGIFVCDNVHQNRETASLWLHAMHDADNLYFVARFNDPSPLNNPRAFPDALAWQGDCLHLHLITRAGQKDERVLHTTCYRDRNGKSVINVQYGRDFKEQHIQDATAEEHGAKQTFLIDKDKKGYVQEIALPWKLLFRGKAAPKAGDDLLLTVQAHFTGKAAGELTVAPDLFRPGMQIDRLRPFLRYDQWCPVKLAAKGKLDPRPIRLFGGGQVKVAIKDGVPTPDFSDLPAHVQPPRLPVVTRRKSGPIVPANWSGGRPIKVGGYEIGWTGLNVAAMADMTNRRTSYRLDLTGELACPPDAELLGICSTIHMETVTDERGRELAANATADPSAGHDLPARSRYYQPLTDQPRPLRPQSLRLMVHNLDRLPAMFSRFSGTVWVLQAARTEHHTVDAAPLEQPLELCPGAKLTALQVDRDGHQVEVTLSATFAPDPQVNPDVVGQLRPPFIDDVVLIDDRQNPVAGRIIRNQQFVPFNQQMACNRSYVFQLPDGRKPKDVRLKLVTEVTETPIRFEQRNVMLPD